MRRNIVVLMLLMLGLAGRAWAQDARNGTNAAPQMLIPIDARYLGGGGAVALASGIESILWNPAGLDQGEGDLQVMLARRNYLADIGINMAGVGMRFGSLGAIAVHLRNFAIGEIEVTDEFHMDGTGETFTPTLFTLGATYGRAMTDRIRIGTTFNLVYESFANVSASGLAVDAGVQYNTFLGVDGLQIGVALRNIGTSMKYDGSPLFRDATVPGADRGPTKYKIEPAEADMPTVVDISASYMVANGLNLGVTYMENTYGPSEIRSLASYNFMGYLTVRGAYSFAVEGGGIDDEGAFNQQPAFGATLNLQPVVGMNVELDYGYMSAQYFDGSHIFALRAGF